MRCCDGPATAARGRGEPGPGAAPPTAPAAASGEVTSPTSGAKAGPGTPPSPDSSMASPHGAGSHGREEPGLGASLPMASVAASGEVKSPTPGAKAGSGAPQSPDSGVTSPCDAEHRGAITAAAGQGKGSNGCAGCRSGGGGWVGTGGICRLCAGTVVAVPSSTGTCAGLILSMEMTSGRPLRSIVTHFDVRSRTGYGPSYGRCSGPLWQSRRTNTNSAPSISGGTYVGR